ncbi:hypothetical protein SAMN05421810_104391 [Amycolatopsis arida]|uniref:Uncharacterized protein n=1 Tax=Amycolatopsis arida TaxID=587909 RepID=A0A1I5VK87_9PSEU|nr:hypothetical protein [Amycolatopsis arida]TDX87904.1 hypothetical protein CLV69_11237 [Amycolatopsis arida]SFQ07396.1 hypothetical protein SAMN05421810_104391 [Amycolatopsis arida]
MTSGRTWSESDVASLAEEIRLLVELVVERAAPWLEGLVAAGHGQGHEEHDGAGRAPGPDAGRGGDTQATENSADSADSADSTDSAAGTDGPDGPDGADTAGAACGWCPLCAVVALVRGERPELAARLVAQAAQLVALLRAVLADRWQPEEGVHMPGFQPAPRPAGEPATGRVQRIPVRRVAGWAADGSH